MPNLNSNIGDTVDALNDLRNNSIDPVVQKKIQALLTEIYFPLWQILLQQQFDSTTAAYTSAATQLDGATASVKAAIADISRTAQAISDAVAAAKAVDKVVGVALPLLALL